MTKAMLAVVLALSFASVDAQARRTDRDAILRAVRPEAAALAHQRVRVEVDTLTVAGNYAILTGQLVRRSGKPLDWSKATGCDPGLDKRLFAVLMRSGKAWDVRELEICATEPAGWSLEASTGLTLPCAAYAGLHSGIADEMLDATCRRQRPGLSPPTRNAARTGERPASMRTLPVEVRVALLALCGRDCRFADEDDAWESTDLIMADLPRRHLTRTERVGFTWVVEYEQGGHALQRRRAVFSLPPHVRLVEATWCAPERECNW